MIKRLLLLLLAAVAFVPASPAQTAMPQVGEVIDVRVINVDVVVTDREGKPVRGLSRDDFELFENGQPVDIDYFSRIAGGHLFAGPETDPAAVAPASAPPDRGPITWAIFVDQSSMDPGRRNQALRHLQTFLEKSMIAGNERAILTTIDGTAFRVRQPLTDRRDLLLTGLKTLERERVSRGPGHVETGSLKYDLARARTFEYMSEEEESVELSEEAQEYLAVAQDIGQRITLMIEEEVHRTRKAMAATGAMLDLLADLPGRIVLVHVGTGFNTLPALGLTEQWREQFPDLRGQVFEPKPEDHQARLEMELQRLFTRMSSMRITLYTIHPGGMGLPGADDPGLVNLSTGLGERAALTEAGLAREMADRTGGLSFRLHPGLSRDLASIGKDLDDYYSLGYTPTGPTTRSRSIRVRLRNRDIAVKVRHRIDVRESVSDEPDVAVAAARLPATPPRAQLTRVAMTSPFVAAPLDPQNAHGIIVEASAPRRQGWGEDRLLPFKFTVGLNQLNFVRTERVMRAEFLLHFSLVDRKGTIWPIESRAQALEIPGTEIPAEGENVPYAWNVDLTPLRIPAKVPLRDGMKLSVMVEDRDTHRRSVVTVPIPRGDV